MIQRMESPLGRGRLPDRIPPMMAKTGSFPAASVQDRWAFEMKWDGVRLITYFDGVSVRAMTRNDREVSASYPEIRDFAAAMGGRVMILDGEVVAFDSSGRPDFGRLQQRMHVQRSSHVRSLRKAVPVTYLIFDVLHLDDRSLLDHPYGERRRILDDLGLSGPCWAVPPVFFGAGEAALAASVQAGLEGVVAKRLDTPYEPGHRSGAWLKVKNFHTQEIVIGGWKPGQGAREGKIGSLLMGLPGPGGLVYIGNVGSGLSDSVLRDLYVRLRPLERRFSPFAEPVPPLYARDAHWVEPRYVAEVRYGEWTQDGRLRHPVWRGLRPDRDAADVAREP